MQIVDIHQGPGLQGVPRGTIKKLRLFTYNFSYQGLGGQWDRVGLDGPWDIKRIIGTVPVEADGSANFEVPANQPISIQPLDEQGQAVALMRSWTTSRPGEVRSCTGCHEQQNNASTIQATGLPMRKPPAKITPFYGPLRGFHFDREVQPVLDRHCIACHNGEARADGKRIPDFRRGPLVFAGGRDVMFPPAYVALKSYVRNPTAENDIHVLLPYEFHASTTELVQLLEAGHHGVKLEGSGTASARVVRIPQAFWMSACEISNAQYARFNPRHDSRIEHGDFLQFSVAQRGCPLSGSNQPVCHVSWDEAQAFCQWLSERSRRTVKLPSGDAWEYACRSGAATPMAYGDVTDDFSGLANLADVNLRRPVGDRSGSIPESRPAVTDVNDGYWVSAPVGSYPPNAWGLHEMCGNVWEWTADLAPGGARRLVRGGSWYVRPHRATPDATLAYQPWQKVYDVGFRVIVEEFAVP